jgi:hypothetical protein
MWWTRPLWGQLLAPLRPSEILEWLHGACPAPLHGGLVVQVPAPIVGEVQWECQPHRVPVDLLYLDPHYRRE